LSSSVNILSAVGTIIFVLTLIAGAGLYGYAYILNGQIAADTKSLALVQSEFDPTTTNSLVQASNRIKSAQALLNKHIATSNMFTVLEQSVLPQVKFNSFDYVTNADGTVNVSLTGEAVSYAALAEQSAILAKIPFFQNAAFSNLTLSPTGGVTMSFSATIDPNLVSYKQTLQSPAMNI
jgi:hypothetical protein